MTGPETPLDLARAALEEWDANDPEMEPVDVGRELADAIRDLIREHEALADAFRDRDMVHHRLLVEYEQVRAAWIDPARLEALTRHPAIRISPLQSPSMGGERWIITGGHSTPGNRVEYARTFPEALALAEARR